MADKRKSKKRKEDYLSSSEEIIDKPSKEEKSLAKWMRGNVPIKKTKFLNHNVEYFTARRAVDILLESKWTKGDKPLFKTRDEIVDYLHIMLEHKFYHRALKVPVSDIELKGKKRDIKKSNNNSDNDNKKNNKDNKDKITDAENNVVVDGKQDQNIEKEKRKKKIRLDMHNDQIFVDSFDAYVWIYDPIPFYYWIIGSLLVVGAIGVCLFPLWPPTVRIGVYYLSVAAAGFLVIIIILAFLRLITFCLIWLFTMGKHHLWILPNLTEDVGFFASFWPLYTYEYKGNGTNNNNNNNNKIKKDKKKKKDKQSDNEDDDPKNINKLNGKNDQLLNDTTNNDINIDEHKNNNTLDDERIDTISTTAVNGASESESESSQRSSTGKDFEILDQEDIDT